MTDEPEFLDPDMEKTDDADELERLGRTQQLEDVRAISNTDEGKRFFKRFADSNYMFNTTMTGPNSVLNEGMRVVAITAIAEVARVNPTVCAEILTELLVEKGKRMEEQEENDRAKRAAKSGNTAGRANPRRVFRQPAKRPVRRYYDATGGGNQPDTGSSNPTN